MEGETLLQSVVQDGRVDYDALRGDDIAAAVRAVAEADLATLRGNDRYAFLLNAYNLLVLHAARRRLVGGKDLNNLWTRFAFFFLTPVVVGGRRTNLYRLERGMLGGRLRRDPRGHFALVCASSGCPPLRDGLFHGDTLDDELELASRAFLRPGGGYRLDRDAGILWASRIFKWYRGDFASLGGIEATIFRYAPEDDATWIKEHQPKLRFLAYDWSLNKA